MIQAFSRVNYADIQTEGYGTLADHDPTLGFWNEVQTLANKHGVTVSSISKGYVKVSEAVKFQHFFLAISKLSPYLAQEFLNKWLHTQQKT